MSLEELSKYTIISKYSRWLEKEQRREVWEEVVQRYEDMMLQVYPQREAEIKNVCQEILAKKVMPSMRALQFAGYPMLKRNERGYNCTGSYVDRLAFFPEALYLLLCGCGVGFSVQRCHTESLPRFSKARLSQQYLSRKKYVIPDSIEGWANAHAVLLTSYHEEPIYGFEEYLDCEVDFDFSQISPKGCPLSFGVGLTPGPEPLVLSVMRNRQLLNRSLTENFEKMDSLIATDFVMHMADAVLAGGVRRSACSAIFDLDDKRMLESKTGDWYENNKQRCRANISAALLRDKVQFEDFYKIFECTKQFGEPGIWWTDHEDCIPNPCFEIGFYCRLNLSDYSDNARDNILKSYRGPIVDGHASGWQMCNLCTINGRTVEDQGDFYDRCNTAAKLGTWQAGFTKFPFLGRVTEEIVKREALLGVSISGMMHKPDIFLDAATLNIGSRVVKAINKVESSRIGINQAARTTAIKPDGNSASALGSFSGCGPGKFRKGLRRVQANRTEAPFILFKQMNPDACEKSGWSATDTDEVISFPVEYEGIIENDVTALDMLENIETIYKHWIAGGKNYELCVQPWLKNNVSNTVKVREHEWEGVAKQLFDRRDYLGGVSLLPWSGDRDYVQAPFTEVFNDEEREVLYGKNDLRDLLIKEMLSDPAITTSVKLWNLINLAKTIKEDYAGKDVFWLKNFRYLSDKFFDGDLTKTEYCVKDYYNWKLYCKLKDSFYPVDYHYVYEESPDHNLNGEQACAGGQCQT